MPSIFEQLNNTNRTPQETVTPEMSLHVKKRLHRVGQQLVAQRNVISAVSLFIIIGWLWLSYEPLEETTQPVQQALALPKAVLLNNSPNLQKQLTQDKANTQPSANTSMATETIKPSFSAIANLSQANQKAIELALSGQTSQATLTLEQALLDDPQAGVLFDNLRRLYAGFASQSYQLALEPNKPKAVTVELASADRTVSVHLDSSKTNNDSNKAPARALETPNTSATAPDNKPTVIDKPISTAAEAANVAVTKVVTPVVNEPTPAQKEAAQRKANQQAIHQALKHWSDAWSKQDVKGYFASYAPTYSPKSTTRKAWMDYRQERILAPKRIKIELSDVKIVLIKPNLAKVSFLQSYTSDSLSARDQKSLEFELINQSWLITNESGR